MLMITIVTMRLKTIIHADCNDNDNDNDNDDDAVATDDNVGMSTRYDSNCVFISAGPVSHWGVDWGGNVAPRSSRRSLRPTPSVHQDVSSTQTVLAKAVDQVCQQADRKMPSPLETQVSSDVTLWKKVEDYVKTDPNMLLEEAIHLLADTVFEGDQDAAARFVTDKLSGAGVPQSPGIFTSNVLQFNFSKSGHWRREPSNQEVRKMARSMSMSTFRQAWH